MIWFLNLLTECDSTATNWNVIELAFNLHDIDLWTGILFHWQQTLTNITHYRKLHKVEPNHSTTDTLTIAQQQQQHWSYYQQHWSYYNHYQLNLLMEKPIATPQIAIVTQPKHTPTQMAVICSLCTWTLTSQSSVTILSILCFRATMNHGNRCPQPFVWSFILLLRHDKPRSC
jgi:hypothetical protein